MSRSNPTEGVRNPSTRWFEWAGGNEGGFIRWYDKEAKKHIKAEPFTFLLLDELSTVKGWHDPSESGIYANEVKDTREDVLVVRSFKGGELASGIYTAIKDRIGAIGGHYCTSIYLAYKEGEELKIGNLSLKGAGLSAWMDFKKGAPAKKHANGKDVRGYYVDAVKIVGFEELTKGKTVYRVPKFALQAVSEATNQQTATLDVELQAFLSEYLKRPRSEAAKPQENGDEPPLDEAPPPKNAGHSSNFDDFADDIPF